MVVLGVALGGAVSVSLAIFVEGPAIERSLSERLLRVFKAAFSSSSGGNDTAEEDILRGLRTLFWVSSGDPKRLCTSRRIRLCAPCS